MGGLSENFTFLSMAIRLRRNIKNTYFLIVNKTMACITILQRDRATGPGETRKMKAATGTSKSTNGFFRFSFRRFRNLKAARSGQPRATDRRARRLSCRIPRGDFRCPPDGPVDVKPSCILGTELQTPKPKSRVRDFHAPLEHHLLDVAEAQAEAGEEADTMGGNLARDAVSAVARN